MPKKGIFTASVLQNKAFSDRFYRLTLELEKKAKSAFSKAVPGQFAEIEVSNLALPAEKLIPEQYLDTVKRNIILRRPFSFADVAISSASVVVEILYAVLGAATLRMKTLKTGDSVSIIGPLGNGFSVSHDKKLAILVAGGMGAPPIVHLSGIIKSQYPDTDMVVFVGTKSLSDLVFFDVQHDKINKTKVKLREFEKHKIKTHISTDDGSAGYKGFVTDNLKNWLLQNKPDAKKSVIYACGPELMLRAAAVIASEFNIPCQVSMERRMACGTGLCQSCAVKCINKTNGNIYYKLCCKDGPVFPSDEIVWE